MDTPAVVLVPPTPLRYYAKSPGSPSSTPSNPQSPRFSTADEQRASSETTIFSIYSMYGDDQPPRASWSASAVNYDRKSKNGTIIPASLTLPDTRYHTSNAYPSSQIAYYDSDVPSMTHETDLPKSKAAFSSSSRLAGPRSAMLPNSLQLSIPENHRPATSHSFDTSSTSSVVIAPSKSLPSSIRPSHSKSSSRSSPIPYDGHGPPEHGPPDQELPPLPPSLPSSLHPSPTPSRNPSPTLLPPGTPKPLPLKHPIASSGSPGSITSLVPSEGEDMDSFHVRNTYAQLEATGVKGDGYEEGVERTRARLGASRSSQLKAEAAIGDGTEKTRELHLKEIETLRTVDRYGFFLVPSHDRLILLPLAPLAKRLSPVSAGQASASTIPITVKSLPRVRCPPKEPSRIFKWTRMLRPILRDQGANVAAWGIRPKKEPKLRARIYKGIPDSWRSAGWELLMSRYSNLGAREMGLLSAEYQDALDKPSTYDIQIDLDVPRTISGHIMFKTRYGAGQRSLFHVLHCFSLRCDKCGYVQGMGSIAATFLNYFEPERVYASLVRLHDAYAMHTVFSPGFPGLLEAIYVQERITEQMMPDVYAAFKRHTISTTSYATKWYITLFANSVPFQTQLRLWDAFLLEGYDVFIAMSVAIVWTYRDHITSSSANFETVLSLLSSFFVPEDEDTLLFWIGSMLGDKKMRAHILQWKEEWRVLVATGKDGAALL